MVELKAQVSLEYLVILAVLVVLTAVATAVAFNFFSIRDSVKNQISLYSERIKGMKVSV